MPNGSGGCRKSRERAPDSGRSDLRSKKAFSRLVFVEKMWTEVLTPHQGLLEFRLVRKKIGCCAAGSESGHKHRGAGRELIERALGARLKNKCSNLSIGLFQEQSIADSRKNRRITGRLIALFPSQSRSRRLTRKRWSGTVFSFAGHAAWRINPSGFARLFQWS